MYKDDVECYSVIIYLVVFGMLCYGCDVEGNRFLLEFLFVGYMFLLLCCLGEFLLESMGFIYVGIKDELNRGKVDDMDLLVYDKFCFECMIEISKEQYDCIFEFLVDLKKYGFDMNYDFFFNVCIDFVWGVLNYVGLCLVGLVGEIINYEGVIKVLDNICVVNVILQQVKDSELDRVQWNLMLKQMFCEWMFIENGEQWCGNSSFVVSGMFVDLVYEDYVCFNQIYQQVVDFGVFGVCNGNVSVSLFVLLKEQQFLCVDEVVLGELCGDIVLKLFIVQGDCNDLVYQCVSVLVELVVQVLVEILFERVVQLQQNLLQCDVQYLQEEQ